MKLKAFAAAMVLCMAGVEAQAQMKTKAPAPVAGAPTVQLERIKVRSAALEGNLEGEAVERPVIVALPPSYGKDPKRRYPVIYALHGYSIGAEDWINEIHVPQTIEGAFAKGAQEMIVVLPDSRTAHNGSMYSRSVTTGDFETFIARDLVAYIDANYRTLPRRESRGLAGHSMGGYGTTRIGMRHSDVFGALYMMSPCCLSVRALMPVSAEDAAKLETVKSLEDAAKLSWGMRAQLATAAAWSPNPKKPPLYLDLPSEGGEPRPDVLAKWAANAPLAFVDQHIGDLRRYRAISIDVGDKDMLKTDAEQLHRVLDSYGIANSFEIYPGDHTSDIAFRFQDHLMPFFSKNLSVEPR